MALDTEAKRRRAAVAAGLPFIPTPPKADGDISEADRAILAGVYVAGAETGGSGDTDDLWRTFRDRYHHEKKSRSRYN